ncbi:DUF3331 domain-containing protein [Paraburkholderia phenazinium]|jgi:hypothetical protein|uniref:DUF3331 domain-containing protein n=2 Tax=Paraburkholderia TaxID=1822464 RepID=UPI00345BC5D3
MLNAECDSPLETFLNNDSYHASIGPMLLTADLLSSHRPAGHTSADPWTSMLATIREFSSPPDPKRQPPHLSRRSWSDGGQRLPRKSDRGEVRPYTVRVVEALSNSRFSLCWHDPTLCNYEEQVWVPCRARSSGRCALSGKRIGRGDCVYRPRGRGPSRPLNGDAMILASELATHRAIA